MAKKAKKNSVKSGSKTKPSGAEQRSRSLPTRQTRRIYHPDDIALGVAKLFPGRKKDWAAAASLDGFLRIRPAVEQGIVGLFGSLALGNPPSPEDVDAWEASKPKDHWDYVSLFDFISVPAEGNKGGLDVVIFHSQNSFEARPLEVVFRLHMPKTDAEYFITEQSDAVGGATEQQVLQREWGRLSQALEKRFGRADLKKQRWKVGRKVYDVSYPDQ